MLDDNLKVLSRRINDLEIELQDRKEKVKIVQKQYEEIQQELQGVYDKEGKARNEIVSQMRGALEEKDSENQRLILERQNSDHKWHTEIEQVKSQQRNELELI